MDTATNFGGGEIIKKTFMNHVFSTTEEGKAEVLNVLQYSGLAIIPIVILNKIIQRFIPDADPDKSSLEIVFEIILQVAILFIGMILIHRIITFIPAYSGFPYGNLLLTNSTLTFLIIVFSIQTKLGIKVNILVDRLVDLWNGTSSDAQPVEKQGVRVRQSTVQHRPSQADHMDPNDTPLYPQPPISTNKGAIPSSMATQSDSPEPVAANSLMGGFSSFF